MYLLIPAQPGCPGQRAVKWVRVCVNVLLEGLQILLILPSVIFTGRKPFLPPNQQCQRTNQQNCYTARFVVPLDVSTFIFVDLSLEGYTNNFQHNFLTACILVLSPNQPSAIDWTKKKITQTGIFSDIVKHKRTHNNISI